MTVANQVYKVQAEGNGSATVFSFSPMVIFESGNLEVTITDIDGNDTLLTEGTGATNYSVSVSAFPGTGSVTYPAAGGTKLQVDEVITIKRVLTIEQQTDLENQGGYFPDVQETAFDRLTMIDLQQQEEIDRVLKVPVSDLTSDLTIPTATARANKVLAFNAAGEPIAGEGVADVIVSSFVATIVDDANAAEVRSTIGLGDLSVLDTVGTSEIDDNSVTLAKLEHGTQGDILYYGASGTPTRLGVGTNGQFLKTQGASANPVWADVDTLPTASQAEQEAGTENAKAVTPSVQQYHPSSAKAWCVFNGTGTPAIAASYNCTSLTDNAVGNWDVNLTTAMSSINYSVVSSMASDRPITSNRDVWLHAVGETASIINVNAFNSASAQIDMSFISVAAFGDQ